MSNSSTLKVTVDPSGAETGAQRVEAAIARMEANIDKYFARMQKRTSSGFRELQKAAESSFLRMEVAAASSTSKIERSFSRLNSIFSKMTSMLTGLGATIVTALSVFGIYRFVDALVDLNNNYNAFIATLEVSTKSSVAASKEYEYLYGLAQNLGVEFTALTKSYAKFTAAVKDTVLEGQGAREVFESIATVSTVLHAKGYDTERMFYAITQSISKGRIYREELVQQLAEKLPGAMKIAAQSMDMTQAQLNEALTKGTVNVYEFWLKFSQALKEEYGGAAEKASQMAEAQINRLRNAITSLFVTVGQNGAMDGFINLVKALTALLTDNTSAMALLGQSIGGVFQRIADWINTLTGKDIDGFLRGIGIIVFGVSEAFNTFFSTLSGSQGPTTSFIDFAEGVAKGLNTLAGIIAKVIALFDLLFSYMEKPVKPELGEQIRKMPLLDELSLSSEERKRIVAEDKKLYDSQIALYNRQMSDRQKRIDSAWDKLRNPGQMVDKAYENIHFEAQAARFDNYFADNKPLSGRPIVPTQVPVPMDKDALQFLLDQIEPSGTKDNTGPTDREIRRAYQREHLKQIKELSQAENEYNNILENKRIINNENINQMEELLANDERFIKLSEDKKLTLLNGAAAIDFQKVKLEDLRQVMSSYLDRVQSVVLAEQQLEQIRMGGLKQFNAEDEKRRSTMLGGTNQFLSEGDKSKIIEDGRILDEYAIKLAIAQKGLDFDDRIREIEFENELIGKNALEIQTMIESRKIDNEIRKQTIGLTAEQSKLFIDQGEILKKRLNVQLEKTRDLNQSAWAGASKAINNYLDDIINVARTMESLFTSAFKSIEDTLVEFVTTRKITFRELFNDIKVGLARAFIQQNIIGPILGELKSVIPAIAQAIGLGSGSGARSVSWDSVSSIPDVAMNLIGRFNNSVSNLNLGLQNSIEGLGVIIANGQGGIADAIGGALGQYSSQISTALGIAGAAFTGLNFLRQGNVVGAALTGAGFALGGPIGGAIGGAIGSLFGGRAKTRKFSTGATGDFDGRRFVGTELSGIAGYNRSLGSSEGLQSIMKSFSETISGLMGAFGLDKRVTTSASMFQRVSSKTRAWGYFGAQAGGGTTGNISLAAPAGSAQQAFEQLVELILTKGITNLVTSSNLPEGVKALFEGLADKESVQKMVIATINLGNAQDELLNVYNLTADQAGKVALQTGLAGEALADFVNKLATTALSAQKVSVTILKERSTLSDLIGSMPASVKAFDDILKAINTSTTDGRQQFADLFSLRDRFAQFSTAWNGVINNVNSSLYGLMTPAQQLAIDQANLKKIADELGIAVPKSVQELIKLGQGIDYTTETGLDLALAFPLLVQGFNATKQAVDSLISSLNPEAFTNFASFAIASANVRNGTMSAVEAVRIPSYDVGTSYVPNDGIAMLHQGEAVITRSDNSNLGANTARMVYLLDMLLDEISQLKYETKRSADGSQRTAREIEDITSGDIVVRVAS